MRSGNSWALLTIARLGGRAVTGSGPGDRHIIHVVSGVRLSGETSGLEFTRKPTFRIWMKRRQLAPRM